MRTGAKALSVVLIAASLGACAPVTFAGGSALSIGVAPGAGLQASQCSLLVHSPEAMRIGVHSPAIQVRAVQNRVSHLQSRFSLASRAMTDPSSWRRIASGEC